MSRKYSHLNDLAAFGFLVNAFENRGGNGDYGASFPRSDAEDLSCGCRFIPGEVTMERRAGRRVEFHSECTPCCWYWKLQDGSWIYHWDPLTYDNIARANGRTPVDNPDGIRYPDGAGPCPHCGNPNTNGGTVK